jgi:uncharacterized protein (TIGR00255 family)
MISSMTGYGMGEVRSGGITVAVEVRSVNSRFLEVATRLPRTLSLRENDIKEIVRKKITRGKVSVIVTVEKEGDTEIPLRVNVSAARSYYKLLNDLRKAVKSREKVTLDHLLRFSDVIGQEGLEATDEAEWKVLQKALGKALDGLAEMRRKEGGELMADFRGRIQAIESMIGRVEEISKEQIPAERERLRERISDLTRNVSVDEGRLEMEIALLAEKLDVTEECVRFRSHNKFFLEAITDGDGAGRKLNFLVQEMNREANTIGSKSSSVEIAHLVVRIKEEMEKVREQLQNVE